MSKKVKKFALIGTSSVGKTTLVKRLENALEKSSKKKIVFVEEAARYYFERNKVRNLFSYKNQRKIQSLAKRFEKKAHMKNPDIIICDRSVLDAVAYVKTKGKRHEWQELLDKVRKWLGTYDHFFLLDPEGVSYRMDKIRREEDKVRMVFHKSFLKLLSDLSLPHTLISGSKKERLEKMMEIIL